jgi:outer membrane receptor protein involved in Fe transport
MAAGSVKGLGDIVNLSVNKTLYRSLLLGAASAALASGSAFAQANSDVETVVVTGSLIQHTMGDQPIPTVIIDSDTIAKTGQANIGAVLAQLPQVANGGDLTPTNSNFLTNGFGSSQVDLRNLGADRTLVLVNGRRWVSGTPKSSAVDLNTIPTQLIDRVETTTGGGSAAYGSDAVAGVVNIILKQDFEGVNANFQYGGTSRGDGGDAVGSVMVGGNFLEGKGNITVVLSYEDQQKVMSGDRDITSTDSTHLPGLFPCVGAQDNGCFFLGSSFSSFGPGGNFAYGTANPLTGVVTAVPGGTYDPDGNKFNPATEGFDRNPNRYIQVPVIRRMISETGHLDVAPWATFFFEGTYAYTSAQQQLEPYPGSSTDGLSKPTSAGGQAILIPLSNPFYLASGFSDLAPPTGAAGVLFNRRFADLGDRTGRADRDTARVALGFRGDFGSLKNGALGSVLSDWKWEASYVWGRTAESQTNGGYYDKIKMQQALNAHTLTLGDIAAGIVAPAGGGGAVCDDPIARAAGCVPINLFGAGSITPEASNYVGSLVTLQDQAIQQVATLQANGSLFTLPAGAVKLAVGGEYRNESARFIPDAASQAGTVAGNQIPATAGAYDVKEAFAEGLLPVLKDLPFAEYVELDGSVRYARYSTAGDATSWKYGATWQVNSDFKLRGSEASATRAPNIGELFAPNEQTFPGITGDLCSAINSPTVNANVKQNCQAQIAAQAVGAINAPVYTGPSGSDVATLGKAALQGVGGYASGNANLKPETAYTFTGGFVYTPSWLQGFQLTSDFFDIRVHDYIGTLDPQTTQQACYESDPSQFANNIFCQQIFRQYDNTLGPIIKQINFPSFNLGSIKTAGVDTTITYSLDLGDLDDSLRDAGSFTFNLNTTYTSHFDVDAGVPGVDVLHEGGDVAVAPMWRGLFRSTYTHGPLEVTTTLHYIGHGFVSKEAALGPPANTTELEGNRVPAYWYVDLNVAYDVTDNVQAYVGADNLFDTRPPETFQGGFDDTGTNTAATVYDPIGLFVYGGVNLKM